jgi:hypothetical protein
MNIASYRELWEGPLQLPLLVATGLVIVYICSENWRKVSLAARYDLARGYVGILMKYLNRL